MNYLDKQIDEGNALRCKIENSFSQIIDTDNLVSVINSLSKRPMLTAFDIDKIDAEKRYGKIATAKVLLKRLFQYYPECFDVLIKALELEDVNKKPLADAIKQAREELRDENYLDGTEMKSSTTTEMKSSTTTNSSNRVTGKDDFKLGDNVSYLEDDQPDENVSNNSLSSDMPLKVDMTMKKEVHHSKSNPEMELHEQNPSIVNVSDNQTSASTAKGTIKPLPENPTVMQPLLSGVEKGTTGCFPPSQGFETPCEGAVGGEVEESDHYETIDGSTESKKIQTKRSSSKKDKDFEFNETQKALSQYKGWHNHRKDKTVVRTFKSILEDNRMGCFMIWYWERKKRPAVCVSHNGKLVTFVIHRRKSENGDTNYYIDKNYCFNDLGLLVKYHLKNGISYGTGETTIELTSAISDSDIKTS